MTTEELKEHSNKYSQTAKKNFGLWVDNFEAMCLKTVLKLIISKYGPMSTEMQRAVISDSSVINDPETLDVEYVDNDANATTIELPELDTFEIQSKFNVIDSKESFENFVKGAPVEYWRHPEVVKMKEETQERILNAKK
jgi:recombination protein RecT